MIWSISHKHPQDFRHSQQALAEPPCQRKRKVHTRHFLYQNENSVRRPSVLPSPAKNLLSRHVQTTFSSALASSIASKPVSHDPPVQKSRPCLEDDVEACNGAAQTPPPAHPHLRQRPTLILHPADEDSGREAPRVIEQKRSAEALSSFEVETVLESIKENALNARLKTAVEELESLPLQIYVSSELHSLLLKQCGQTRTLLCGKRVHEHIRKQGLQHGTFLGNYLINMYRNCGDLASAASAFDDIHRKNVISWTIIISAYAQSGQYDAAIRLFGKMQKEKVMPDKVTMSTIIGACSNTLALEQGREIHQLILDGKVESDIVVDSALVNMYVKCGSLEEARNVFDGMQSRNVVPWTIMITAYSQHNQEAEALKLFREMITSGHAPNEFTLAGALSACSRLRSLQSGQHVHAAAIDNGFDSDVAVGNSLIHMYSKCGYWDMGLKVFCKMHKKDVISWTSMLDAYTEHGRTKDTLQLFEEMQWEGMIPDKVTFLSILAACADLLAFQQGKRIHTSIVSRKLHTDHKVGCALIHMYGKCGSVESAREAFDRIHEQNVHTWTAIISVYSQHGFAREALVLFSQMLEEHVRPNEITFVSILSACSYGGFISEAWRCFTSISRDFGITPTAEHYACMVDTLGRAGFLEDAKEFIMKMPVVDEEMIVWRSMLISCSAFNDIERGKWAAEKCIQLEPSYGSPYIMLCNIYAASQEWEQVARIKQLMEQNGVKRQQGKSSIEIKDKIHDFVVDDQAHPQIEDVRAELDRLYEELGMEGYIPCPNSVLHEVEEELKPTLLKYHSERLAIAFGHIMTPSKSTVRITKNMRVCTDCHRAIKLMSRILEREIIVRDPYRIHRFKEGKCSCLDYW